MRTLLVLIILIACLARPVGATDSQLPAAWQDLLVNTCGVSDPGARVACLSHPFLGIPYQAGTLGGGPGVAEQLTIELAAVDCFTLLDYIEALRRSATPEQFPEQLVRVRYRSGVVSWPTRRHFFSDWIEDSAIREVTAEIGGTAVAFADKELNRGADGEAVLPEVPMRKRRLAYLPTDAIGPTNLARLRAGDYLGIYATKPWLDVSHVGLLVKKSGQLYLRHASSRDATPFVIDSPLLDYLAGKPGIIVLRPVAP